jgi:hypothetical protein
MRGYFPAGSLYERDAINREGAWRFGGGVLSVKF